MKARTRYGRGNKFFCYDYFDEIFLKVKRNNMHVIYNLFYVLSNFILKSISISYRL